MPPKPARWASKTFWGLREFDRSFAKRLEEVAALIDPCDADPDTPLVLLPVRLETRYATEDRRPVLKVRIYPDEIHVDDLVRGLTDEEAAAGQAFWRSVWTDPASETAFPALVAATMPDRAEWVAHATRPVNLDQRGALAPVFPDTLPRGSRNVVARALPDRFVVFAVQDGVVRRELGRPIPPDLPLTPIPMPGDDVVTRHGNGRERQIRRDRSAQFAADHPVLHREDDEAIR